MAASGAGDQSKDKPLPTITAHIIVRDAARAAAPLRAGREPGRPQDWREYRLDYRAESRRFARSMRPMTAGRLIARPISPRRASAAR